jgi:AI-2 transport protein TqsA
MIIQENKTTTTEKLLFLLVIPLVFYVLHLLKFIFIPLLFAIFIALLFMPVMRWFQRKNVHRFISLTVVLILIFAGFFATWQLVKISAYEIISGKDQLYEKLDHKIGDLLIPYAETLQITINETEGVIKSILSSEKVNSAIMSNIGQGINIMQQTLVMLLMTLFFLVLLLAGSINFKTHLLDYVFNNQMKSIRTFMRIEKSIVKFLVVKFLMSFFTGVGFSLVCFYFDISFPIFWGFFAFLINFVQMIGSIISTVFAAMFTFIEIDNTGVVLTASLLFALTQVIFGSILEPILMGKSFSINVVMVLVMLMLWGFVWGIPGLILSIPLSVLIKTVMEQFDRTKPLARLMS